MNRLGCLESRLASRQATCAIRIITCMCDRPDETWIFMIACSLSHYHQVCLLLDFTGCRRTRDMIKEGEASSSALKIRREYKFGGNFGGKGKTRFDIDAADRFCMCQG